MRSLLNPRWLLIINTLPIVLLIFIFWSQYSSIHSLLEPENVTLWKTFGIIILFILGMLNFIYCMYLIIRQQKLSYLYGLWALLLYIPFLYLYGYHADDIIPFSIPRWMVTDDILIYTGTFLMPTLIYSLLLLVTHFTQVEKNNEAWKSFVTAIMIPLGWYLFSQLLLPFWQPVGNDFSQHALIIFVIVGTVLFLFFLIRGIYIISLKKSGIWKRYQLVWKIAIALTFPLLGLAVNQGMLFDTFSGSNSCIFGNFGDYRFFVLALLNGLFICLPNSDHKIYRLLLFIGRSMTFGYTFYFFLVFLPYLPLSLLAIIAFGLGFLMLTPLALFIIHINELSSDYNYLKEFFSNKLLRVIAILGFLVIPFFITTSFIHSKSTLNETLNYLYSPSYSKEYSIDKSSLSKTLSVIKQHKGRNRGGFENKQIPYLSTYFNWLVLDNLTLSDPKINTIEQIFYGKAKIEFPSENLRNTDVAISNINSSSHYDTSQNAWISWVNLEITNHSKSNRFNEYSTTIDLPVGSWISDYYLYVGDRKEMGILAEKKSAMWVFSQIRNENKDPGILYYLTGNKVAFRVFPFAESEVRKTGIEIIHKEPLNVSIDNHSVALGTPYKHEIITENNENIAYVSTSEKSKLPIIQRTPYYHFLVDVSKGKKHLQSKFINRIEQLLQKNTISKDNAQISFVNSLTSTFDLDEAWKNTYANEDFDGGFYLDRAIKTTLFNTYINKSNSYPVIVVVTDSIQNAIIDSNFSDLEITFPESDLYYHLDINSELKPYSLLTNKQISVHDSLVLPSKSKVLAYPNKKNPIAFLRNNNVASIVMKKPLFDIGDSQITAKNWESGLKMQGEWISQLLYPETTNEKWLTSVKHSFMSKIMTPQTSYIVVENEAQKAILKKKQDQVLSGNKNLDLNDDTQRMSEPSFIIVVLLLLFLLWVREKRNGW